jgi:hypothetical protein
MAYQKRILKVAIMSDEASRVFDDGITMVEIQDEGGGEFIIIEQFNNSSDVDQIRIDVDEWPHVQNVVLEMINNIKKWEECYGE